MLMILSQQVKQCGFSSKGSLLNMLGAPLRVMVPLWFLVSHVCTTLNWLEARVKIRYLLVSSILNFQLMQEALTIISQVREKFLSFLYPAHYYFTACLSLLSFCSFPSAFQLSLSVCLEDLSQLGVWSFLYEDY